MNNKPNYEELEQRVNALESENEKKNRFLRESRDGVYHLDLKNNAFEVYNDFYKVLFMGADGKVTKKSIAQTLEVSMSPEEINSIKRIVAESLQPGNEGGEVDYKIQFPDGTFHWLHDRWKVVRDSQGNPIAIEGIIRDITDLKKTEEKLRESEKTLRSIFKAAPVGIGVIVDRVLLHVNDRFCEMMGYSEDELLGQSARMVYLTDEDYEYVGKEKYDQIRKFGTGTVETRFKRKTGEIIDVLLSSTPIEPGDLSKGVTFTALDITERKHAETALSESEENLRTFIETAPIVILALRPDGTIFEFNPEAVKLYGREREEVLGTNYIEEFLPEDARDYVVKDIKKVMSGEPTRGLVNKVISADGIECTLEWYVNRILDSGNNPIGIIAIGNDITERKQAEEAMKSEGDKLKSLFNGLASANIGIDIVNIDYEVLQQNQTLIDRFGDIVGKKCYKEYMALEEPCSFCPMVKALEKRRLERTELQGADGRYYEILAAPLANSDGTADRVIEVVQEITERKQAEQKLQASEERYRGLVNNMQDIVHSVSADGTILFIGPQIERYEFTEEEMISQPFVDFIHPEDRDVMMHDFQHTIATGEETTSTFRITTKDGRVVWFEETGRAVCDASGNITSISGMLRDITEKKVAQEALRDSERKLHAIFDHHYQLTGLIDTEGRILAANPTALSFAGVEESEVIGSYFWDGPWWYPSQRSELRKAVERAARGEFVRFETTHPTAEGEIRNIDFSLSPVQDDDGEVIYIVPEGRDITEIRRAEGERAKLQEQLNQAQKMESIGTLAGGIAHDFNNILSPIMLHSEMIMEDLSPDSPLQMGLKQIYHSGERARDLVTKSIFRWILRVTLRTYP